MECGGGIVQWIRRQRLERGSCAAFQTDAEIAIAHHLIHLR